jgi:hypothetical protein
MADKARELRDERRGHQHCGDDDEAEDCVHGDLLMES